MMMVMTMAMLVVIMMLMVVTINAMVAAHNKHNYNPCINIISTHHQHK